MLSKNATKMLLLSVCYLSFHSEQFLAKIMLSHLRSYFHRIIDEKIMNIYCWFLVLHLMLSIRCNKIRIWTIYNYYVIFTIKFCVITVLALVYFFTRPIPIINFRKKVSKSSVKKLQMIFLKLNFSNISTANLKTNFIVLQILF